MKILDQFLTNVRRDVDYALDELIPAVEIAPVKLHEAIRWSVFAGGKRIRPAILMAVGRTFAATPECLVNSAAAVEMIHTYSLIHDDLPAMDNDDLRRGKATCHIRFGDATAILAGDVLQTIAFKSIAEDTSLPPEIRLRLISLFGSAAGTPDGMVSGQQLDLDAEGKMIEMSDIERIHGQKTGALISAAAVAGAIIGGADENELNIVKQYADKIGLLFQITDDLLDVTQATAMLGKTAGKDATAAKATYPGHYGVDRTREMAANIHREALAELADLAKDTALLSELAGFVYGRSK